MELQDTGAPPGHKRRSILVDSQSQTLSRGAALSGFALFAVIGAALATFGPTIPAFRSTFHVSAAAAGLLLSGHFAGSLVGTLSPGFLPHRLRSPRLVAGASAICFACGCLCIAGAPVWPAAITGAVVEGAGWGGLVIAFNSLFTSGFGGRSPAMLTLLNAVYGIGAVIGPAGTGLLAGGQFRGPFLVAAIASLLLLPSTVTLPRRELAATDLDGSHPPPASGLPLIFGAFIVAMFLYGGLEAGLGAWIATHLISEGLSVTDAAAATSLFWAAFTVGRLVAAPVTLLVRPQRMVIVCVAAVSVVVLLARVSSLAVAAYVMCGLLMAPLFPLSLAWSGRVLRVSQRTTASIISGDLLGGVILSALLGRLITATAPNAIPFAFAAMAGGMLCILLGVQWRD